MVRSDFSSVHVCYKLATLLKINFWKFLEELLFEKYQSKEFLTKLYNAEISQVTLLVVSPHDALAAILKTLGTLTRNICGGVTFSYSHG